MLNEILEAVRVDWENEGCGALPRISREWLEHMQTDDSYQMRPRSTRELVDHGTHYRAAWLSDPGSIELARKVLSRLSTQDQGEVMTTVDEAIQAAKDYFTYPRTGEWDETEEGQIVKILVEALEGKSKLTWSNRADD